MQNLITPEINFEVGIEPLQHKGNVIDRKFITFRKDTGEPLGIVGKNYKVQQHVVNIPLVAKAIDSVSGGFTVDHKIVGSRIFSTFDLPGIKAIKEGNEDSNLQVIMVSSHDGSASFGLDLGIVRLICSNGQIVIDSQSEVIKRRHFQSLNVPSLINQLPLALESYAGQYRNLYEKAKDRKPINLKRLTADAKFPKKLMNEAMAEFKRGNDKSAWGQYNALTHAITHKNNDSNIVTRKVHSQLLAGLFQSALAMNI